MILNCCCGGVRPQDPDWVNLDDLFSQFSKGPEREQLNKELNYRNHNVLMGSLPFMDGVFDGVLLAHALEHFDAKQGLFLVRECYRVLRPGGIMIVSVPDASYFRQVHELDVNPNWPDLFGISDPKNPIPTFFEAALWFDEHFAILTEDSVWAYLRRAGFGNMKIRRVKNGNFTLPEYVTSPQSEVFSAMHSKLDRLEFSLVMAATK